MAGVRVVRAPRGRRMPQLRRLREARGWYQSELADKAGVTSMSVSRAERGSVVGFDIVKAVAAALEVSPDELCREEAPQSVTA